MNRIPGKVAHRKAATKADLLSLLVEREIGYCDADKTAYIRIGNELHSLGGGRIDKPTTTSLLMGFLEDAETYTYDWKSLESIEPIPNNPLKLWSRLAGMGLYAEVAHMDSKGRDISEQLDYASVLVAVFDETDYATIADAVSEGKSVILSIGNTQFAYLYSVSENAYIFRTLISGEHTYTEYAVGPDDIWNVHTVDIGESTPTLNSNKLLTSGGAYEALKEKADVHNTTSGTFPKVSVNEQGIVTEGHSLDADDIPGHSADTITSGYLNPDRLEDGSIPAEKLEIRKKLMVDGITIGATETQDAVVLHAIASGAFGYITRIDSTDSVTVDSSIAGNHSFDIEIPVTDSTRGSFWAVQVCLDIQPGGASPSVDYFLPIVVSFAREYADGGSNSDASISTSLVRTSQTGPWRGGTHEFRSLVGGTVTKVIYSVEWGSGAIFAGTVISYSISAYVFG